MQSRQGSSARQAGTMGVGEALRRHTRDRLFDLTKASYASLSDQELRELVAKSEDTTMFQPHKDDVEAYINAANTRLRMLNPAAPLIDRLAVVHPTVQPQATVVRQPPALPVAASVLPPAAAAAAKPPSAAAATAAAAAVAAVPVSAADVAAYWHERNALAKLYLAPFERFLEHVAPLVVGDNAKSNTFQTAVTTAKQMVEVLSGRDARLYPLDKLRKTGVGVMDFVNRLAEKMRAAAAARAASTASLPAAIVTATPVATAPVAAPVAPATLSLAACRYGLARWLDDADCALFCVLDSPIAPPKRARLAE